jgi:hypothetical protein
MKIRDEARRAAATGESSAASTARSAAVSEATRAAYSGEGLFAQAQRERRAKVEEEMAETARASRLAKSQRERRAKSEEDQAAADAATRLTKPLPKREAAAVAGAALSAWAEEEDEHSPTSPYYSITDEDDDRAGGDGDREGSPGQSWGEPGSTPSDYGTSIDTEGGYVPRGDRPARRARKEAEAVRAAVAGSIDNEADSAATAPTASETVVDTGGAQPTPRADSPAPADQVLEAGAGPAASAPAPGQEESS